MTSGRLMSRRDRHVPRLPNDLPAGLGLHDSRLDDRDLLQYPGTREQRLYVAGVCDRLEHRPGGVDEGELMARERQRGRDPPPVDDLALLWRHRLSLGHSRQVEPGVVAAAQ